MKRRSFLTALAGLPFVGGLVLGESRSIKQNSVASKVLIKSEGLGVAFVASVSEPIKAGERVYADNCLANRSGRGKLIGVALEDSQ